MSTPFEIFELVDATDDERYYTLGLFLTLAEAMAEIQGDEPPNHDNENESPLLEVRRRPLGFHPHAYTTVATRQWVRLYPECGDPKEWDAQPIKFNNPA